MSRLHYHHLTSHDRSLATGTVLAIGNMDGVHLGHAALLNITRALAGAEGHQPAVLTFSPHPRLYFNPERKPLNLLGIGLKIRLLQAHGMHHIFIAKFNKALAGMSAEQFVTDFCMGELHAKHIVTGANFRFGKGRLGDAELMASLTRQLGIGYSCVEPVLCNDHEVISSTRIRELLGKGDVHKAAALLGRPYAISGRIIHGDKRGQTIGFPTANIPVHHLFQPAHGVYTVRTTLHGVPFEGVANLGIRPTFEKDYPMLEMHFFESPGSLYGKRLTVELHHYLRPEQKFESRQSMIDQIQADVVEAKLLLPGVSFSRERR